MLATDPTQPILPGWSRVSVQFPGSRAFFDMQSSTIDKRLADFEEFCGNVRTPMALQRLRYTDMGAVAVGMVAENAMAMRPGAREVVCTAALWCYVYQTPVALPVVPDPSKENRKYLEHFIQRDGGFLLNCTVDGAGTWSFKVSSSDLVQHGAAAMPEAGLPSGTLPN
jgi:hypothetical protein